MRGAAGAGACGAGVKDFFRDSISSIRRPITNWFDGDIGVIVGGVENEQAQWSLYSTVHGAGRTMGRMEAKGKFNRRTGRCLRPGKITPERMRQRVDAFGTELRGGGLDESPHCYKDLQGVLDAHAGTIRILHTRRPIGVAMADTEDPHRD